MRSLIALAASPVPIEDTADLARTIPSDRTRSRRFDWDFENAVGLLVVVEFKVVAPMFGNAMARFGPNEEVEVITQVILMVDEVKMKQAR
jgi:hypothetical protein